MPNIDRVRYVGLTEDGGQPKINRDELRKALTLKLGAQGFEVPVKEGESIFELAGKYMHQLLKILMVLTFSIL